jgi:hypothetical protein
MINKFSTASYSKKSKSIIVIDKDDNYNLLSDTFSAKLLLITWQNLGSSPKDKDKSLGKGIIRAIPSLTEIGRLPPIDYNFDVYNESFIQFLDLTNLEVNYQLSFKNPKGITRTQVSIREYVEDVSYQFNQQLSNSPIIA